MASFLTITPHTYTHTHAAETKLETYHHNVPLYVVNRHSKSRIGRGMGFSTSKGYVGEKVYDELVKAGFEVTVLARSNLRNEENVRVIDYDSTESLTQALLGHDAVVSTLAVAAWPLQYKLIDAAVKAGSVKHFIPSDYTALSSCPEVAHLPFYKDARATQEYLRDKTEKSGMKWTVVATGPLLGCVLNGSYMYNFQEQTALQVSNQNHQVSMTRRHTLGKAIAAILSKSNEVRSGPMFIHDVVTTQTEMLRMAEKASGKKWPVQHVEGEAKVQEGLDMLNKAGANGPVFATFLIIHGTIFGGKYRTAWDGEGNKFLDLPMLPKDEFESLIEQRVRNEPIDGGLPWNSTPKPRK
ncbi:NmrA-like family protein [Fusarium austroafricanum]|uniref:NmrA-like family protein n=1 Tax=Fusarium austroafricanum TaxID=2364996 RepID=A0A8H4JZ84_9HYPO|nr:NmrA-like family protein [Fusarium austroafricanum]